MTPAPAPITAGASMSTPVDLAQVRRKPDLLTPHLKPLGNRHPINGIIGAI